MNEYNVSEDAGAVSVCIDSGVTEGFQRDLIVSLIANDGMACKNVTSKPALQIHIFMLCAAIADDTDLPSPELTVVFPAGSTSPIQCRNITITDDDLLEGSQEFTLTISDAGLYAPVNALSSITTITIFDDES